MFSSKILKSCKERLLSEKEEVLNTLKVNGKPPESEETLGDFGDQNIRAINEHQWFLFQNRLRKQLLEIESALHRLESGEYGICEETEQLIEAERILTLPWTRLSLEGAKLRESLQR
ncbi:MAG: TraR/DksA family transcriptional regulator [Bdellovibrionota bacterium]